jgi:hypothetical protein
VLLVAALALGLAIGWIDSRPHWDDSGITTGLLLLSAALMGLIGPRRPWLWALAIGIWVPLWVPARAFLETHRIVFDPLLLLFTLAVSMVGAYAGMAVRRLYDPFRPAARLTGIIPRHRHKPREMTRACRPCYS